MIILLNLISLNNNIAQFDDRAMRRPRGATRPRDTTARGGLVKILSWMRHCLAGKATFLSLTAHGRGKATILSFGYSMFTSMDSIGSAVGKRPMGFAIATSKWPTEY